MASSGTDDRPPPHSLQHLTSRFFSDCRQNLLPSFLPYRPSAEVVPRDGKAEDFFPNSFRDRVLFLHALSCTHRMIALSGPLLFTFLSIGQVVRVKVLFVGRHFFLTRV